MAKHVLLWREGRATPEVIEKGARTKRSAGGKIVARRVATAKEEQQIAKDRWVTTRPPGHPNMRSKVRPQLARRQKNRKTDRG